MGYIEQNLIAGEIILYKTGRHWISLLVPGLFGGFCVLFGSFIAVAGNGASTGFGVLIAGFGAFVFGLAVMVLNATEMTLTSERLLVKAGLLRRRTIELFLSRVESVVVDQGLLGRILDYGSIVIKGTGGPAEPFNKVCSPLEFRRQVQQHRETLTTA